MLPSLMKLLTELWIMFGFFKKLFSTPYRNYSANRVITDLDNGWKPFIIDVRSIGEANGTGKIPGCKIIQPHFNIQKIRRKIPQEGDILVYCAGGVRSSKAINTLMDSGVEADRLVNMRGGFRAYASNGGKISRR